jgi:hypothetical protein
MARRCADRARAGVEEILELTVADEKRVHGADGLHGGGPVTGEHARHLADDIAGAAHRFQYLLTIASNGSHPDPSRYQDKDMS